MDRALQDAILELLRSRAASSTICPSEAARVVAPDDWRALMEPARSAARRLAADEVVVLLQKGRTVDAGRARGPVRLGRGPAFDRPG